MCLAKRRLLEELGHGALADAADRAGGKSDAEPRIERGKEPAIEVAYGKVAPATVLIRTSEGMGSGVIVDERGYVLTNHHVVEEFLQPDLTIKVSLELGHAGPTGRVVPKGTSLEGIVVKADPIRDLALVKIVDPPAGLAVGKIAPIDPRVGEEVLSVGNAGIGLLWAAKVCNVSRVGDLTRETSALEAKDCSLRNPSDDDQEAIRRREQCEARKKEIRRRIEEGEIVGLNQSLRGGFGGSALAFHVHVAEVRDFMREIPSKAAAIVPDPFCEGGSTFKLEDSDGDGSVDMASAGGHPFFESGKVTMQGTFLFDLAADTRAKRSPSAERPFPADVALLLRKEDAYVFYDRDGDGSFDVLLRDQKADGKPDRAYRLEGGAAISDPSLLPSSTLDAKLLGSSQSSSRLGAAATAAGMVKLASREVLAGSDVPALPDLQRTFGKRGHAQDVDDDKKVETIFGAQESPGEMTFLIDVKSPAMQSLKSGDEAGPVLDPWRVKPQYVLMQRPSGVWALYDRDGNGDFDLAMFGKRPGAGDDDDEAQFRMPEFATHAYLMNGGKLGAPAPEHLGRQLARSDIFTDPEVIKAMRNAPLGMDSARGSFPDPFETYLGDSEPWTLAALDRPNAVLEQKGRFGRVVLIDLDGDTKKSATSTPKELANADKFDAEIAYIRLFSMTWAYYDTNRDGAFDLVFFSKDASRKTVDNAVRLSPDGKTATSEPGSGALLRSDLVPSSAATRAKIEALFAGLDAGEPSNVPPAPPGSTR
jgi:hypothetical protein